MAHLSVRVTRSRWREFIAPHLPAVALGLVAGAFAWGTVEPLRVADVHPLLRLVAAAVATAVGVVVLAWRFPVRLLGPHGIWMRDVLWKYLPSHRTPAASTSGSGR
jgi:hypothetical protein